MSDWGACLYQKSQTCFHNCSLGRVAAETRRFLQKAILSVPYIGKNGIYSSRCTVSMANAGRQTAMYSAPLSSGVE